MNDILYRAAAYLLIIALGVFLKKVGFFHEQDFRTLAKILLNITLPCAIIYSFSKVDFQISLLTVTGLSLFVGILMMFIAFFTSRMTGKKGNIPFDILNLSGYNIGNFCLPFAQSFLEPLSLLGITLFDIFKLNIKKDGISHVIRILFTRYAVTISFAAIAFFCLPFPLQIRQALVLAFLSPIASACPAYTDALGEDYELSSTINSISMLISIGLITAALIVML